MMNAIYRGRVYRIDNTDDHDSVTLEDKITGARVVAPYEDETLIIDPTDDEYFATLEQQPDCTCERMRAALAAAEGK